MATRSGRTGWSREREHPAYGEPDLLLGVGSELEHLLGRQSWGRQIGGAEELNRP